jgi:FixJ family two-component response regulator
MHQPGGAFRYITKPWNDEDLVHAVHDAIERYRCRGKPRLTALTIRQNEELKKWSSELELYFSSRPLT